jgi:protein-S-isoprenylcysteine O-methyltransferase Ste14
MNVLFKVCIILFPISFFVQLTITEYLFKKKGIKYGGYSPINKNIFVISKYSVLVVWVGMILDILKIRFMPVFVKSNLTTYLGLFFWIAGFSLLYIGRFSLGQSFRIGVSNEKTQFIVSGIYKISRNPMYIGLYATLIGCMFYTLNIVYILISLFIIIMHHLITLGEEKELLKTYGEAYKEYCDKVRRYF